MRDEELKELERRLDSLPDIYPDFTRCTMASLKAEGLEGEILSLLRGTPDATTELVIAYELLKSGSLEMDEPLDLDDAPAVIAAARQVLESLREMRDGC